MQIKRIALNAVMIAVYVVLSMLVIPMGGLKITFEHFPVVLCAVLFGPVDAIIVGFAGEFINQMWSFGMTPTTLLWIFPIVSKGFIVGVCAKTFKKSMSKSVIVEYTVPIFFYVVCILSGVISSLFNTLALYVDSKMFGYYSYVLVFGSLAVRILLSVLTSVVIGIAIKPILHAIKKTSLV